MAGKPITIKIIGDASGFTQAVSTVEAGTQKLSGSLGKVASLASGLGAVFEVKSAVGAFVEDEASAKRLEVTLKDTTNATNDQVKATEAWIKKTQEQTGITDSELRPALGRLLQAGRTQVQAQSDMTIAMDISIGRGKDLSTVVDAMAKGAMGNETALKKMGVATKDASGAALSFDQILQNASKTFGGQMAANLETGAGKLRVVQAQFHEFQVNLGAAVMPAVADLANVASHSLIPALEQILPAISGLVQGGLSLAHTFAGFLAPLSEAGGLLGGFALASAGVALALGKIVSVGASAVKAFADIGAAATGSLTGGLAAVASLVGGMLVLGFINSQREAAATAKRTDELAEAMRGANDPVQQTVDRLAALEEQLKNTGGAAKDTADNVKDYDGAWASSNAQSDKTVDSFNSLNILGAQLADVTNEGSAAFRNAAHQADLLGEGTANAGLAMEGATGKQRAMIQTLWDAHAAGKISDDQLVDMLGTLDHLGAAWDKLHDRQKTQASDTIDLAVSRGRVTQGWVDEQMALAAGVTEREKMIAVGKILADQLGVELPDASGKSAAASDDTGAALAREQNAAKELQDGINELKRAQDHYFSDHEDRQAALDDYANKMDAFRDSIAKNGQEMDGNSKAARDNRAAFNDLEHSAGGVVTAYKTTGATAEEQVALVGNLTGQFDDLAGTLNLSGDKAGYLTDQLNHVPTDKVITFTVQEIKDYSSADAAQLGLSPRAGGGPVKAGQPYLVGEDGPELVVPGQDGTVIPAGPTAAALGGGQGGTPVGGVNYHVTINGFVGSNAREMARMMREELRKLEHGGV